MINAIFRLSRAGGNPINLGNPLSSLRTGRDGSTCWARSSLTWALCSRSRRLNAPASTTGTPLGFVARHKDFKNKKIKGLGVVV